MPAKKASGAANRRRQQQSLLAIPPVSNRTLDCYRSPSSAFASLSSSETLVSPPASSFVGASLSSSETLVCPPASSFVGASLSSSETLVSLPASSVPLWPNPDPLKWSAAEWTRFQQRAMDQRVNFEDIQNGLLSDADFNSLGVLIGQRASLRSFTTSNVSPSRNLVPPLASNKSNPHISATPTYSSAPPEKSLVCPSSSVRPTTCPPASSASVQVKKRKPLSGAQKRKRRKVSPPPIPSPSVASQTLLPQDSFHQYVVSKETASQKDQEEFQRLRQQREEKEHDKKTQRRMKISRSKKEIFQLIRKCKEEKMTRRQTRKQVENFKAKKKLMAKAQKKGKSVLARAHPADLSYVFNFIQNHPSLHRLSQADVISHCKTSRPRIVQFLQPFTVSRWIKRTRDGEILSGSWNSGNRNAKRIPEAAAEGILKEAHELVADGSLLTGPLLCGVAHSIFHSLNADGTKRFPQLSDRYQANIISESWARGFLRDNWFTWRKLTSARRGTVEDRQAVELDFNKKVAVLIAQYHIPRKFLLNADETGIPFLLSPDHTRAVEGSKEILGACFGDKRQVTGVPLVSATGDFLGLQVIFQGKTQRAPT